MINEVKIGTTVLKNITNLEIKLNDLDQDTGRNARGNLIRNRIAQIPEIDISFGVQNKEDMEELLSLLTPASFTVYFYMPQTQTQTSGLFYAAPHYPKLLTDEESFYDTMDITLIGYNKI